MIISRATTLSEARTKKRAADELLGIGEYTIRARGLGRLANGDLVFMEYHPTVVESLGRVYFTADIDGKLEKVKPTDDLEFEFLI